MGRFHLVHTYFSTYQARGCWLGCPIRGTIFAFDSYSQDVSIICFPLSPLQILSQVSTSYDAVRIYSTLVLPLYGFDTSGSFFFATPSLLGGIRLYFQFQLMIYVEVRSQKQTLFISNAFSFYTRIFSRDYLFINGYFWFRSLSVIL